MFDGYLPVAAASSAAVASVGVGRRLFLPRAVRIDRHHTAS